MYAKITTTIKDWLQIIFYALMIFGMLGLSINYKNIIQHLIQQPSDFEIKWALLLATALMFFLIVSLILKIRIVVKHWQSENHNIKNRFGIRWEYNPHSDPGFKITARCKIHNIQVFPFGDGLQSLYVCHECKNPIIPKDGFLKRISVANAKTRMYLYFNRK